MSLVGKKAPDFTAPAVLEGNKITPSFSLSQFAGKQEVLLVFYPKAFTPVCHSELLAIQKRIAEFNDRHVVVAGISIDTEEVLLRWVNTPVADDGIQGVTYPLIADSAKTIAYNYGVLGGTWEHDEENDELQFTGGPPVAYRGTFLIDKKGIVRHQLVNDLSVGRDVGELLRTIAAVQHVDKGGDVCLVDWRP